jgi:antirestriction protein ArdC
MSKKVYEIIQNKFVEEIQQVIDGKKAVLPWQKPWNGRMPENYISGKRYRGINLFLLEGGEWLTFNQIKKLSEKNPEIKLRKGSKGSIVVFWKMVEKKDKKDEVEDTYPMLRYYYVYNISDVDGIESKYPPNNNDVALLEQAEEIISGYKERENVAINMLDGSRRAYYQPSNDRVVMPVKEQFKNTDSYYSTMFHELSHSTGLKGRLNRFSPTDDISFGNEVYSKEELVAELSSQMVLGRLNIKNQSVEDNSISYAYGWMKAIKEDPKLIVSACAQAQKASDLIFGDNEEDNDEK